MCWMRSEEVCRLLATMPPTLTTGQSFVNLKSTWQADSAVSGTWASGPKTGREFNTSGTVVDEVELSLGGELCIGADVVPESKIWIGGDSGAASGADAETRLTGSASEAQVVSKEIEGEGCTGV